MSHIEDYYQAMAINAMKRYRAKLDKKKVAYLPGAFYKPKKSPTKDVQWLRKRYPLSLSEALTYSRGLRRIRRYRHVPN